MCDQQRRNKFITKTRGLKATVGSYIAWHINNKWTLKAHLHPRVIAVDCFCFEMLYCPNAWSYWLSELKRHMRVSSTTRAGGKEYSWSLIAFSLDSRSNKMGGFSYMKTVPRRAIHLGWMWAFNKEPTSLPKNVRGHGSWSYVLACDLAFQFSLLFYILWVRRFVPVVGSGNQRLLYKVRSDLASIILILT